MDMQVAEKLGLKPLGEGKKASGLTFYEAQSLNTGLRWSVWGANKKTQGKLIKWYEAALALCDEGTPHLKCLDTSSGLWVAAARDFGLPLEQYRPSDAHRVAEVLSLTYRFLDALSQLERSGIPLRADMFNNPCILERGGLPPRLGFPGLYPLVNESSDETVSARLVGRFLYVLLTGNAPPTEEPSISGEVEGERVGAFDSLLLDWVEEHTLHTGLGGLAMQAYDEEIDSVAFSKALYPHLEREVAQLVLRSTQASAAQIQLRQDADTSRLRIEALETCITREEMWLKDHADAIEKAEDTVSAARERLRQLEALYQGVAAQLGLENHTDFDLLHRAPSEDVMPALEPTVRLPAAHNDEDIALDADQLWPDDPKMRALKGPEVEAVAQGSAVEADSMEPEVERVQSVAFVPVFISGLVLGGLVVAFALWVIWLTDTGSGDDVGRSSLADTVSMGLSTSSKSSPTKEAILDVDAAAVVAPDDVDMGRTFGEDVTASTMASPPNLDQGVVQSPDAALEHRIKLPAGMVQIARGRLSTILTKAQAESLVRRCSKVFGDSSPRCAQILEEVAAVPTGRDVAAFGLDLTEVEFTAYLQCVRAGVCSKPVHEWNKKNYPVTGVSAEAAKVYCRWRKKRLPTNSEWMMAVRSTKQDQVYPWGDEAPSTERANLGAWDKEPVTDSDDGYRYVAPVLSFQPGKSDAGVLNLVGNVKELVVNDQGDGYLAKGAGYLSLGYEGRVTSARVVAQSATATDIGFRCVVDL